MAELEIWRRKSEPDRWHVRGDVDGETLCGDTTSDMEAGDTDWEDVILLLRCGKCVTRDEQSRTAFGEVYETCPDQPDVLHGSSTVDHFPAAS